MSCEPRHMSRCRWRATNDPTERFEVIFCRYMRKKAIIVKASVVNKGNTLGQAGSLLRFVRRLHIPITGELRDAAAINSGREPCFIPLAQFHLH